MVGIIEVVGTAGVGKSTLTENIRLNIGNCNTVFRLPKLRTLKYQAFAFARHILPLLRYSEVGCFKKNMKLVIYIESLSRFLYRNSQKFKYDNIVFDQGVFFSYASLCNIGLKNAPIAYKDILYSVIQEKYFPILSEVIFLSAQKEILEARVMSRASEHRLKTFSLKDVEDFFVGYLTVFKKINSDLRASDIPVIDIDTSLLSSEQVFDSFEQQTRI